MPWAGTAGFAVSVLLHCIRPLRTRAERAVWLQFPAPRLLPGLLRQRRAEQREGSGRVQGKEHGRVFRRAYHPCVLQRRLLRWSALPRVVFPGSGDAGVHASRSFAPASPRRILREHPYIVDPKCSPDKLDRFSIATDADRDESLAGLGGETHVHVMPGACTQELLAKSDHLVVDAVLDEDAWAVGGLQFFRTHEKCKVICGIRLHDH